MSTFENRAPKETYQNILHVEGGIGKKLKPVEDGKGQKTAISLSTSEILVKGDLNTEGKVNGIDVKQEAGFLSGLKEAFTSFEGKVIGALQGVESSLTELVRKVATVETGADKTTLKRITELLAGATLQSRLNVKSGVTVKGTESQMDPLLCAKNSEGKDLFIVDNGGSVSTKGAVNGRNIAKDGSKLDNIQAAAQRNDGKIKLTEDSQPVYLSEAICFGENIGIEVVDGMLCISATPQKELPPKLVALMEAFDIDDEGNITTAGKVNGVDMKHDSSRLNRLYLRP